MNHYDDDTLYKFVLDILKSSDLQLVSNHLNECDQCSNKINEIQKQIELLKSYEPQIELKRIPDKITKKISSVLLKSAAVILIGLSIGYSTSLYLSNEQIEVIGQTFIPHPFANDSVKYVICPNVDIHSFSD